MNLKTNYLRNIYLIYIIFTLYAFAICWNVIQVLFFQANNLTFFQISTLLLTLSLVVLLFEIPTGAFADMRGRKLSLILFSIMFGISSFIFAISSSYLAFLLAIIFLGMGYSFWSGTANSILYESLKGLGKEKLFTKYLSKTHFLFVGVGIITNYSIPLLFEININYPFYLSAFLSLLLFVSCLFLDESLVGKRDLGIESNIFNKYKIQISESLKLFKGDGHFRWLLLFSGLWGLGIGIFSELMNQPLIIRYFDLGTYGVIFATATIVQTILLFYLDRIIESSRKSNPYLVLIMVWSAGLILMLEFIETIYILVPIMGVIWLVGSFKSVLIEDELNQNLDDDSRRATILSINSMFGALVFILVLPIFGVISDTYSIEFGVYVISGLSFVTGLILLYLKK